MSACALGVFDAALFFLKVYLIDESTVKRSRSFLPVVLCEKFYVFFCRLFCFSPNPVNDGSPNICQLWRCASVRICIRTLQRSQNICQNFAKFLLLNRTVVVVADAGLA